MNIKQHIEDNGLYCEAATCERAYQRGQAGSWQIRSSSGRLLMQADHCLEPTPARYGVEWTQWRRVVVFGSVVWLSRIRSKQ